MRKIKSIIKERDNVKAKRAKYLDKYEKSTSPRIRAEVLTHLWYLNRASEKLLREENTWYYEHGKAKCGSCAFYQEGKCELSDGELEFGEDNICNQFDENKVTRYIKREDDSKSENCDDNVKK